MSTTTLFYIARPCARQGSKYLTIINTLNLHNNPTKAGTINIPLITGEEAKKQRHRASKSPVRRGQASQDLGAK